MKYMKIIFLAGMVISLCACGSGQEGENGKALSETAEFSLAEGQEEKEDFLPSGREGEENSLSEEQEEKGDYSFTEQPENESGEIRQLPESKKEFTRMVMLNDKLYVDTGELSFIGRCGVMDFQFDSSVEGGTPTENNQTNFGIGYNGQLGMRENRIEIYFNDKWHIFACHENDIDGVTMEVTENTASSVKVKIKNETDLDIEYGDDYALEILDEEIDTWVTCYPESEIAFHDIAYSVQKGKTAEWSVDLANAYGVLEPGRYRIVKKVNDFRGTKDYTTHTFTAEFDVPGT